MPSSDTRNAKVVALLILSMTTGAAVLLWFETPARRWAPPTLLLAERGRPIEDVLIEFAGVRDRFDPQDFDCLVYPDGRCEWRPRGAHIRLLVVGSDADRLEIRQARALLAALGSMHQLRGLDPARVRLHPDSDPLLDPRLGPQAHDLRALLVRKSLIP